MSYPTESDAPSESSSSRYQRQNTPQMRQQSASLTRRQQLMDAVDEQAHPGSSSSNSASQRVSRQVSASPASPGERVSSARGSSAVVCGVRSAFPLIPASADHLSPAVAAAGADATSRMVHRPHRRPSPSADALLREQRQSPDGQASASTSSARMAAAGMNTLPEQLRSAHHRSPRGTPGKPPLVHAAPSRDAFYEIGDSDEDAYEEEEERKDGSAAASLSGDAYPVEAEAAVGRRGSGTAGGVTTETLKNLTGNAHTAAGAGTTTTTTSPSSPFRQRNASTTSTSAPVQAEVRIAAVAAMTAPRDQRRSIHGGKGGYGLQEAEEPPAKVDRRHRASTHLVDATTPKEPVTLHVKPEIARRPSTKPAAGSVAAKPSEEDMPAKVNTRHRASTHLANTPKSRSADFHVKPEIAHRPSLKPVTTKDKKEMPMAANTRRRASHHLGGSPAADAQPSERTATLQRASVKPNSVEVRSAAVAAMTAERDQRRSIHGGGPGLFEEEDAPAAVDMRHRASKYLVSEPTADGTAPHTKPELAHRASVHPTSDAVPAPANGMQEEWEEEEEEEQPVKVDTRHRASEYLVNEPTSTDSAAFHTRPEMAHRASVHPTSDAVPAPANGMQEEWEEEEEEEQPVKVDTRHRASEYLVNEPTSTDSAAFHTKPEMAHRASVKPAPTTTMAAEEEEEENSGIAEEQAEKPVVAQVRHRRSLRMGYARHSRDDSTTLALPIRREISTQASILPASVEVRKGGEHVMADGRDQRRSIHGGGGALTEAAEEPAAVDVRRRSTRVLVDSPAELRRRSRENSHHAQLEQTAVDPQPASAARLPAPLPISATTSSRRHSKHASSQQEPVFSDKDRNTPRLAAAGPQVLKTAESSTTGSHHHQQQQQPQQGQRKSVHAVQQEVQQPMAVSKRAVAAAPQVAQTEARRRSSRHAAAEGQPWFAKGQEKPPELRTASAKTIAGAPAAHGSADGRSRQRSIHSGFAEETPQQRAAMLQTQPTTLLATSAGRRKESQHAADAVAPWYTDDDEVATTLRTLGPQNLAAKPMATPPRHSIHGQALTEAEAEVQLTQAARCEPRPLSAPTQLPVHVESLRGRARSKHGELEEVENLPVAPRKAAAVSQPLSVHAINDDASASDDADAEEEEDGESVQRRAARKVSRHAADRASAYSPIVPSRAQLHSAPLPDKRTSLLPHAGATAYTVESHLSSASELSSTTARDDHAGADVVKIRENELQETTRSVSANSASLSASGRKQQLHERYLRALEELVTEENEHVQRQPLASESGHVVMNVADARGDSVFSYGSVDVARDIRGFFAGGPSDEEGEEEEDGERYDDADEEDANNHRDSAAEVQSRQMYRRVTKTPEHADMADADTSSLRPGLRRRRTTMATVVDLDDISPSQFPVEDSQLTPRDTSHDDASAHRAANATFHDEGEEEEEEEGEYETISCYDVSCQTSQYLFQNYLDAMQREEEQEAAAATLTDPHYMGTNRWMCALGLCPQCHPGRSARKTNGGTNATNSREGTLHGTHNTSSDVGRPVWPIITRQSLGYSAPPRLTRPPPSTSQRYAVTAPASAAGKQTSVSPSRTPHLPHLATRSTRSSGQTTTGSSGRGMAPRRPEGAASARLPSTRSAAAAAALTQHNSARPSQSRSGADDAGSGRRYQRHGHTPRAPSAGDEAAATRARELRQRQRQRQLRDLQVEQSSRLRGGRGASFSPRLLTSHDMQCGLPMSEYPYRYCDLASERMMVHNPTGRMRRRGDVALQDYNDTLDGAPLVTRQETVASESESGSEVPSEREFLAVADRDERPQMSQLSQSKKPGYHAGSGDSGSGAADRAVVPAQGSADRHYNNSNRYY